MTLLGKNRGTGLGELLGGGALVAVATGAITFATSWGGALRAMEDHVDPSQHALIVHAGNVETGEKIAVIETKVEAVQTAVAKNAETAEEVKGEVSDIRSDVRLLLELNRRALARPPPVAVETPAVPTPEPSASGGSP